MVLILMLFMKQPDQQPLERAKCYIFSLVGAKEAQDSSRKTFIKFYCTLKILNLISNDIYEL